MLDISTLYVMVALSSIVAGIVHMVARIGGRFGRWASWWGIGHLLLGVSAVMPLAIDRGAPILVVPVGNAIAAFSYAMIYIGMRSFADPKDDNRGWIAVGVVVAAPLLFWFDRGGFGGRIAYLSVIRSLFDVATVVVAVRIARRESLRTGWIVATMFTVTVPMFLGRGWMALTGQVGPNPTGMHSGPAAWLAAGSIAFVMFRGFSLLTMDAERGEQQMAQLAERDGLTGVSNRTAFERARAGWNGDGAVLMIDLDRFKALNDQHGHATGDAVLRIAARAIINSVPMTGRVFRWGGDEFVCVLPGVNVAAAAAMATEIASRFGDGTAALPGNATGATLSVGWATAALDDLDRLIDQADRHMYARKRGEPAPASNPQRSVAGSDPAALLISQSQHG